MFDIPDHPEVRWIERTGYPSFAQPDPIRCEVCDRELDEDHAYDDEEYEYLCKHCLLSRHRKVW